ncbi:Biotin synthase [bioreactor metagenome]|uniref:biotin synthase n=1 Tax=bioreactor metagenome TaxID=1076179 RepID=A0A644TND6_9ZZZZ|nr:biotin synthase BioB [Negativicutes bacterium]
METRQIITLGEEVLAGYKITRPEALRLSCIEDADIPLLSAYANKIRLKYAGNHVDMCGIINARSGRCSEDCKFCAQSVFHAADSPTYPLLSKNELLKQAKNIEKQGAKRVSLVTSGKGMQGDSDFESILAIFKEIISSTTLKVCANLGTLDLGQAQRLAATGIRRYAHNLETSKSYYPTICTSHPYDERLETILAAKQAGLELCCGGIVGMGESWDDRIELALALRELGVQSIPINILNPLKGTALENIKPPRPLEILKIFAIFRFILPDRVIRPAGGRELNLRDMQGALMLGGANGLIIGNYLTFSGRNSDIDFQMVHDAGLNQ